MKRKKILALTLAAAMSLALFSGCSRPSASSGGNDNPSANNTGSTSSEEPIVIKIGHTDSDTRSTHKWSVWLGEWLEEQAPGRFKVEVYPNGQLGDSPDMVAGVKLGTLTMRSVLIGFEYPIKDTPLFYAQKLVTPSGPQITRSLIQRSFTL